MVHTNTKVLSRELISAECALHAVVFIYCDLNIATDENDVERSTVLSPMMHACAFGVLT